MDQVGRLGAVIAVHVRVVCAGLVLDAVLDELESWQPNGIEREVVRAPGTPDAQRRGTHVPERCQPLREDRPHPIVSPKVDAPDLAGAVVEIEVRRELGMPVGQLHCLGIAEVLLDVRLRTEQPLLFPAP